MISEADQARCPACGFELGFHPWDGDSPSDEICPSCGIQFGHDDAAGGAAEKRAGIYARWREKWIANGMTWWSTGQAAPEGWEPGVQLKRVLPG